MTTDTEDEEEVEDEVDDAEGAAGVEGFPQAVSRGAPSERVSPIQHDQGCVRSCNLMAMPPNNSVPQDRSESFSEEFNSPPRTRRGQWTPYDLSLKCLWLGKSLRCNNLWSNIAERLTSP